MQTTEVTVTLVVTDARQALNWLFENAHRGGIVAIDDNYLTDDNDTDVAARLDYLRGELRTERISQGELAELQDLAEHIDPGDVELLEAAGVPEYGYWIVTDGDDAEVAGPFDTEQDAEDEAEHIIARDGLTVSVAYVNGANNQ
jgi:hypothetical protein